MTPTHRVLHACAIVSAVDSNDVDRWFGEYLDAFAACGRGERENEASALYMATFSCQTSDGGEINRLTATYLVTDGAAGRRISVLAVESP